jgi:transposase
MSRAKRQQQKRTKEFKTEAAKMVVEQRQSQADVARNLGVTPGQIHRWVADFKEDPSNAFPGKGKLRPEDERLKALEAQVRRLTMERDILKKAMAYFAEVPK